MAEIAFGVAGTILERLGSLVCEEISLARGVKSDLEKLRETTSVLKAVLSDASKKQNQDEQLKAWLVRLEDIFNDTLSVLDEFECESLRRRVVREHGTASRKVRRFFSHSNPIVYRFRIAHRVNRIRKKLDKFGSEMVKFELISNKIGQEEGFSVWGGDRETHSFVNPLEVIGRDKDRSNIVKALLSKDHRANLLVIPIVGLGGLGKTTLARSVYNDDRVVKWFDLRMWACPPLNFNLTETIREILKSAVSSSNMLECSSLGESLKRTESITKLSLDQCQVFLRSMLKEKTFLLVLDDVWCDDHKKWVDLRAFLEAGSRESKILVTTRNVSAASSMTKAPPYNLSCLSEEDSLALFMKYAFENEESADRHPHLKKIGRDIVKRCCGVPLAARALGSTLHGNIDVEKWLKVRDHRIWELERECGDPILSALKLSYNAMPSHLKQCFVLCSYFSKHNSYVNSYDLIHIWMALGIIQPINEKLEMEDVGKSYFEDLCTRSFFQRLSDSEDYASLTRGFEMHDLIHDLALSIIQHQTLTITTSGTNNVSGSVRYLTISSNEAKVPIFQKPKKVLSLQLDTNRNPNINEFFISACISRLSNLRILKFDHSSFEVLPRSIGALKHLRYLDLSYNERIRKLPDSVCKLQNLQTLGLHGCDGLEELPRNIKSLISLRAIGITTKQTRFLENGIGRLRSLQLLFILNCKNLESLPQDMRHCNTLRTLVIVNCSILDLADEPESEVVPLSIQKVVIGGLPRNTVLPWWLKGASQTLQSLYITECPKLSALPEWFPNLTSLQKLVISKCGSLTCLPEGMQRLTSLTNFEVRECEVLEAKCIRGIGDDWPKIAHIPFLKIGDDPDHVPFLKNGLIIRNW